MLPVCQENKDTVEPLHSCVVLQKKEEGGAKCFNESLLSRLRPYNRAPGPTATLVALTGTESPPIVRKEDGQCCLTKIKIIFFIILFL